MGLLLSIETVSMECCSCGTAFVLTNAKYRRCKDEKESFYCPNGHSQSFVQSEIQKLQKQIDQEKRNVAYERDRAERHLKSSTALKGEITKLKNRIGNGVCPCCNRSFQNLKRHLECKHPEFKK